MHNNREGISVIICCYNSATRLPETIRHLAFQKVPDNFFWEIVIVNNASSDNTKLTAQEEWAKYLINDVDFIIVDELMPGLSFAREKGVKQAKFEYIIFCDDDNWLDNDYVSIAYNTIVADKNIGAVGGQGFAASDVDLPFWFNEYSVGYAVGKQALQTGDISLRKYVWGAGMVTKKSLFLNAFTQETPSLLSGRNKSKLTAGDDSEFSMRLIFMGYKLFYNEKLLFKHFISKERLTVEYREKLFRGFRESNLILDVYSDQADVALLSRSKRPLFLLKKCTKYLVSKCLNFRDWNYKYEAKMIYHLTGFTIEKVSKIDKEIRCISLFLKAKN